MYTIDQLIDAIVDEWERTDRVPTVTSKELPSPNTYARRFEGGFIEAREYAAEQLGREIRWRCRFCGEEFHDFHSKNRHEGWCKDRAHSRD